MKSIILPKALFAQAQTQYSNIQHSLTIKVGTNWTKAFSFISDLYFLMILMREGVTPKICSPHSSELAPPSQKEEE